VKVKETKIFPGMVKAIDIEQGMVDAYVSIMGILDDDRPPDLIELGAFAKTIAERGPSGSKKIRVLRQHNWDDVVGMPIVLQEHSRDMLPPELLQQWPNATGGLFARTQFVMDVQAGREMFALYKAEAMSEWSIGFDTITFDQDKTEDEIIFRRIKEIRLWEYSPVTWGANPATVTTDVKQDESIIQHPQVIDELRSLAFDVLGEAESELALPELVSEIEKRLKSGAEPDDGPLTPNEIAQLKIRMREVEINLNRKRVRVL